MTESEPGWVDERPRTAYEASGVERYRKALERIMERGKDRQLTGSDALSMASIAERALSDEPARD